MRAMTPHRRFENQTDTLSWPGDERGLASSLQSCSARQSWTGGGKRAGEHPQRNARPPPPPADSYAIQGAVVSGPRNWTGITI